MIIKLYKQLDNLIKLKSKIYRLSILFKFYSNLDLRDFLKKYFNKQFYKYKIWFKTTLKINKHNYLDYLKKLMN